jgi:thymidylate kinase
MAVVCLMGIDGCGKSTLSKVLVEQLVGQGQPAVARWATLRPYLLLPVIKAAKFLLVRKHPKFVDYEAHAAAKRAGMSKMRFAHSLYFAVMVIDYLPQVWWKVGVPRLLGKHVICDRYFPDLALDFALTVNGGTDRMMSVMRRLERLAPRADFHYFVNVPPAVALARKDDVPSIAYLEERHRYYSDMARLRNLPQLDGTAAPAQSCRQVLDEMKSAGALKT